MAIYTVLAPKARDGDGPSDPMSLVFVKEGVSWPALFFAGPWLIYRRMWLVLLAYVALAVAVGFVGAKVGGPLPGFVLMLGHFLFALEGNELRRWTLRRRGYRLIDIAEGRGIEVAEIHYFARADDAAVGVVPPVPPVAPVQLKPPSLGPMPPSAEAGDVVGLFPSPGGAA